MEVVDFLIFFSIISVAGLTVAKVVLDSEKERVKNEFSNTSDTDPRDTTNECGGGHIWEDWSKTDEFRFKQNPSEDTVIAQAKYTRGCLHEKCEQSEDEWRQVSDPLYRDSLELTAKKVGYRCPSCGESSLSFNDQFSCNIHRNYTYPAECKDCGVKIVQSYHEGVGDTVEVEL